MKTHQSNAPYLVVAAVRGPDDQSFEALSWKELVTVPYRWLLAKALGEDPSCWCLGYVDHPKYDIATIQAVKWAAKAPTVPAIAHVVTHMREALLCKWWEATRVSEELENFRAWAGMNKLI